MSNTAVQNDEDLIILGDTTSSDNSLLDFNFDLPKTDSSQSEPMIRFEDSPSSQKSDISFDLGLGSPSSSQEGTSNDDIFNFSTPETTNTHQDIFANDVSDEGSNIFDAHVDQTQDQTHVDSNVSENTMIHEPVQSASVPSQTPSSFTRNDILDEAIVKMQSRKEVISTQKSTKQSKVDELNEEIKKLKKEVSQFESEIKELEKENSTIDLDIASIEKMKSAVLDVSERTRVHNLDNIKKK